MWAQSLRLAAGLKSESELGCGDSGTGPLRHCSNERARAQTFTFGESEQSRQAPERSEREQAGRDGEGWEKGRATSERASMSRRSSQ